jgi:uncharacterized repeat protein (TIGR01451 family)
MDYPSLPTLSTTSINIQDGAFSPLYDIVWSINYEIDNWSETDQYGMCFFLRESDVPIAGGGIGIDLGYSGYPGFVPGQFTAEGLTGGVIGIGIDTHGVFAAETVWPGGEQRSGIATDDLLPNSVTVRGSISDGYEYISTAENNIFKLLSDGPKILRARLGNYGRTVFLDYREPGDTEFVNLISTNVTLTAFGTEKRLTPGVSFAKPLTATGTDLNIKVNAFHVEGKGIDPDKQVIEPTPLTPLDCNNVPLSETVFEQPVSEVIYKAPVENIAMYNPLIEELFVFKEVIDLQLDYQQDDVVDYKITVRNVGDKPITNIALTDNLIGESDNIQDSKQLLNGGKTLAPGEEAIITYSYTVKSTDTGTIQNTASVTSSELTPILYTIGIKIA